MNNYQTKTIIISILVYIAFAFVVLLLNIGPDLLTDGADSEKIPSLAMLFTILSVPLGLGIWLIQGKLMPYLSARILRKIKTNFQGDYINKETVYFCFEGFDVYVRFVDEGMIHVHIPRNQIKKPPYSVRLNLEDSQIDELETCFIRFPNSSGGERFKKKLREALKE